MLALVGPTASGKTEAGLELAETLSAEICSVDSMLVYRGMDIGDRISMSTPDGTFEYRVSRRLVVRPRDTRVLENGSADLTLVTCYPMRAIGPAPDRFIVQARRVPDGQSASR